MAGTEILGRLNWLAARVVSTRDETERVRSIIFECPMWEGHMAGQHVDIRLTAEDGYQAQRSYSIGSAPSDGQLMLTVERLQDGEVSPYLFDFIGPGDELEMRGPIGRYFVWEGETAEPLLLIAGGSGIVPFRAILRHRAALASAAPVRLLYSSRSFDDVIYSTELAELGAEPGCDVRYTLTRSQPEGWQGYARRIDAAMLGEVAWAAESSTRTYVCGPTPFVESAANALVAMGHAPESIRTERFGPTGN
jgi:ferredoxin-NADP reductase